MAPARTNWLAAVTDAVADRLKPSPVDINRLLAERRERFGAARMDGEDDAAAAAKAAAEKAAADAKAAEDAAAAKAAAEAAAGEHGYPANTPLEQMTAVQQTAYWRHQSRKHEQRVKDLGVTPEELKALRDKAEAHDKAERERLPEQERAVAEAKEQARKDALAENAPRLVRAEFKAALTGRVAADQLEQKVATLVDPLDTSKFLTTSGDVDAAKVTAFVDAAMPPGKGTSSGPPNHGQGHRESTTGSGVDAGRQRFQERRGGKQQQTT